MIKTAEDNDINQTKDSYSKETVSDTNGPKIQEELLHNKMQSNAISGIRNLSCNCTFGLIILYAYTFTSIFINIINRIVFNYFMFRMNCIFMFLQQFFSLLFFSLIAPRFENFNKMAGEISFNDFMNNKWYYFICSFLFILNTLSSFYSNQFIINTPMYSTLRKFLLAMTLFVDIVIKNVKYKPYVFISIFLITLGALIAGIDTFSADWRGIIAVIFNNSMSIAYFNMSEMYKKKTGNSNLKLLLYNAILVTPVLVILIFATGDYLVAYDYFVNDGTKDFYFFFWLTFWLFLSCLFCVFLNASLFLSTEKNSFLITVLISNIKDIIISIGDYFAVGKYKWALNNIFGIGISTLGSFIASFSKITEPSTGDNNHLNQEDPNQDQTATTELRNKVSKDENKAVDSARESLLTVDTDAANDK